MLELTWLGNNSAAKLRRDLHNIFSNLKNTELGLHNYRSTHPVGHSTIKAQDKTRNKLLTSLCEVIKTTLIIMVLIICTVQ